MATPNGEAVAVTLVGEDSFKRLCQAPAHGYCVLDNGTKIFATQYFRTLGLPFGLFLGVSRDFEQAAWLGILIINGLPDALHLLDNSSLSHSYQTHYPTESDLVGFWSDQAHQEQSPPAQVGGSIHVNTIPGKRRHPTEPGYLYGVGLYGFQRASAFYDNDGAIGFQAGSQQIGLCWSVEGTDPPDVSVGVAADLSAYPQSDLATFYSRTAGKSGASIYSSHAGNISVTAGFGTAGDEAEWFVDDGVDPAPWNVMIVSVRPQ